DAHLAGLPGGAVGEGLDAILDDAPEAILELDLRTRWRRDEIGEGMVRHAGIDDHVRRRACSADVGSGSDEILSRPLALLVRCEHSSRAIAGPQGLDRDMRCVLAILQECLARGLDLP